MEAQVEHEPDPGSAAGAATSRAPMRARRQARLAALVTVGAVAALLVAAPRALGAAPPPYLATPLLLVAVALVPGGVVHLLLGLLPRVRPVPAALAVATVPALGVAIMSLVVSAQLALARYEPASTTWSLVALGVAVGAPTTVLGREDPDRHPRPTPAPPARRPPNLAALEPDHPLAGIAAWALGLIGLLTWVLALPLVRSSRYSDYGLGVQVPLLAAAVVLVGGGLLLAVRARRTGTAWALLLLCVLVRRGTTLFATEAPMYQWTYRHLGVMDWFTHTGMLARDVDVYSNWPGALAFAAWLCEESGLSPMALAHGYPLAHHVVLVVLVYVLARAVGLEHWSALLAAALAEFADWVGQDYLAPQSMAFLVAIALLAALLWRDRRPATGRPLTPERTRHRAAVVVALVLFAGITWMHLLTTAWLLFLVVALAVVARLRPIWLVVAFAALAAVMAVLNADALEQFSTGFSLNLLSNSSGNIPTAPSDGQRFTSLVVRALALVAWLSAGLVGLSRIRRREGRALLALAFSPVVLLLTGYGGEAIYRVYLYSLPGVALLLAPVLERMLRGRSLPALVGSLVALTVLTASLQGSLGGWYIGLVTRSEAELQARLEVAAGPRGRVTTPAPVMPAQLTWHYVAQARNDALGLPTWSLQNELIGPDGLNPQVITRFTEATTTQMAHNPVYVVVGRSSYLYAAQYGSMPPGALERVERLLMQQGWTRIVDTPEDRVYANPAGVRAYPRP